MLINPKNLLASIVGARCAITEAPLSAGDYIVSKARFPRLYGGGKDVKEAAAIAEVLSVLGELLFGADFKRDHGEDARRFLLRVNTNGYFRSERSLHLYVYHFWSHLWLPGEDPLVLQESYYEGRYPLHPGATLFARKLMPAICSDGIRLDIVGLGGESGRDLYIVEMKDGELDDRAVGQILRYYSHVRSQCDRLFHDCDVRRIVPILVVSNVRLEFWRAIPTHFRELLQIFSYTAEAEADRLYFRDAKVVMSTQARNLLWR